MANHRKIVLENDTYLDTSSIVHKVVLSGVEQYDELLKDVINGWLGTPKRVQYTDIDLNRFGMYTILNDNNMPTNNKNNDWYTLVNFPAKQGTDYSIQIAFSYWGVKSSGTYGVWIKHGRDTSWGRLNIT